MTRSLGLSMALALAVGCSASTTLDNDTGTLLVPDSGADAFFPVDANAPDGGVLFPDTGPIPHDAARPDAPHDAGSVLPPSDGGDPFGDSGPLGDPPWVPLTILTDGSMCTPLVPCGGDITGTWDVGGGCFEIPLGAIMRCPGAVATGSGRSRGRVTFGGTVAHRVAESEVDVQVTIPSFCASFAGGCAGIQTMIRMQTPDSACVTETDMSCLCQIRVRNTINDTDGYTTSGNEIIGASSGKHWAYCVSGSTLEYQDVSTSGMREPGIIDLTRRP